VKGVEIVAEVVGGWRALVDFTEDTVMSTCAAWNVNDQRRDHQADRRDGDSIRHGKPFLKKR
jgi:hypothetical protein